LYHTFINNTINFGLWMYSAW